MKRAGSDINKLWRLLLIPAFIGYLYAFEYFKLIFSSSAPFEKHAWDYLMLALCVAGFLCVMFASSNKKTLLAIGFILITVPIWLGMSAGIGVSSTKKINAADLDYAKIALYASAAVWGLLPVRGKRAREWEKALIALVLSARTTAIALLDVSDDFWMIDSFVFCASIIAGCLTDCAYRSPCLPDLTVPIAACSWLLLVMYSVVDINYAMYICIAACLVCVTALFCLKPLRKLYTGHMLLLAGMIVNAVVMLMFYDLV